MDAFEGITCFLFKTEIKSVNKRDYKEEYPKALKDER